LSQEQDGLERVLSYASRSLNKAERNYSITRKELLAVIFGLKRYRQYLIGRKLVIRTDHSALQWLRRTPEPIAQAGRWLAIMEKFSFEVQHRAGVKQQNAYALSRFSPYPEDEDSTSIGSDATTRAVRRGVEEDPDFRVKRNLTPVLQKRRMTPSVIRSGMYMRLLRWQRCRTTIQTSVLSSSCAWNTMTNHHSRP